MTRNQWLLTIILATIICSLAWLFLIEKVQSQPPIIQLQNESAPVCIVVVYGNGTAGCINNVILIHNSGAGKSRDIATRDLAKNW